MVPSSSIIEDRRDAIIRGIMSGGGECQALKRAIDTGNGPEFLAQKIVPTLTVYQDEAIQLANDRDAYSMQAEAYRQALEYIVSNISSSSTAHIIAYAERALGRV